VGDSNIALETPPRNYFLCLFAEKGGVLDSFEFSPYYRIKERLFN